MVVAVGLRACGPLSTCNREVESLLGYGPPGAPLELPGREAAQRPGTGSVGPAGHLACLLDTGHQLVSGWDVPPWPGVWREVLCAHQGPLIVAGIRWELPVCRGLWMVTTGTSHERTAASHAGPGPHPGYRQPSDTSQSPWLPRLSSASSKRLDILQRSQACAMVRTSLPFLLSWDHQHFLQKRWCGSSPGTKAQSRRPCGPQSVPSPASPLGLQGALAEAWASGRQAYWFLQKTSTCQQMSPRSPRGVGGSGDSLRAQPRSSSPVQSTTSVSAPP